MCGWFEIPVSDMYRAKRFYETVFQIEIQVQQFGKTLMGWFPNPGDPEARGASGSLVENKDFYKPSADGVLIYLSTVEISAEMSRVEESGGKVLQEKTQISPEVGYMSLFLDSEGNRIALHSWQ